jgi:arylsulfatase A-like enzyme
MAGPNLIYVFGDQLRWASCGYNGDANARTPNLDDLAAESVDFCNAVSGHPVCAPYRASLMTGNYTTSTGMVINEIRMNPNQKCFAHALNDGGYETAYIGKWHMYANELGNHHLARNSFVPPGPDRLGFDDFWAAFNFNHSYYMGFYHNQTERQITVHGFEPDFQTDLAIEQIERMQAGDKPFAMFLNYGTPHDPWTRDNVPEEFYKSFEWVDFSEKPPNYSTDSDPYGDGWATLDPTFHENLEEIKRCYYGQTANLDWNLGRLLKALDEMGLRDDTILVFTSDHGECFGAHGRQAKNIFYDEAARVPFLVRWGDKTIRGTTDACLNTVDIMPTLLSMMGLPVPEDIEGMDLSHCAVGGEGPEPEAAFMQCTGPTADWADGNEWRAVRTKQHTFAVYRKDGKELMFDNIADPYQTTNLVDDPTHADAAQTLREMLKAQMAAVNDTFESTSWYRDNWTEDRLIMRSATKEF